MYQLDEVYHIIAYGRHLVPLPRALVGDGDSLDIFEEFLFLSVYLLAVDKLFLTSLYNNNNPVDNLGAVGTVEVCFLMCFVSTILQF